jgi:hypothetical protein
MKNYSKEYIEKSNVYMETVNSNPALLDKLENGNFPSLSNEDQKIVTDWLESGDPAVWEFLNDFVKSSFLQEYIKNY